MVVSLGVPIFRVFTVGIGTSIFTPKKKKKKKTFVTFCLLHHMEQPFQKGVYSYRISFKSLTII